MIRNITLVSACLGLAIFATAARAEGIDAAVRKQAEAIFAATGTTGGLVVHLGCGNGRLTAALRKDESYVVHGLDADPSRVDEARSHIRSLGLYGPVSAERWDGSVLPVGARDRHRALCVERRLALS